MRSKRKIRYVLLFLAFIMLFMEVQSAFASKKVPEPRIPPLPNEFYPTDSKNYPKNMVNPHPQVRDLSFQGLPLDIFTRINMTTQLIFTSPPVLVNIGRPEAFMVEVIAEYNTIFLRPSKEIEMTNMIVHTENGGAYLFVLKENPFNPYDMLIKVFDPYKTATVMDSQTLIKTAYTGRRPSEFQLVPMEIRSPDSTSYIYDPMTKIGCRMVLRRVVNMPREAKVIYWVELQNFNPGHMNAPSATFAIDEKSVWTHGIEKVAVPGFRDGTKLPILAKGESAHIFMIVNASSVPENFRFRFALYGSRNIPIETVLPTTSGAGGKTTVSPGTISEDEKIRKMYEDLVKNGKVETWKEPMDGGNSDPVSSVPGTPDSPTVPEKRGPTAPILVFPESGGKN